MAEVLADSSILIDLATSDPVWSPWSRQKLLEARLAGPVLINQIVYAECLMAFRRSGQTMVEDESIITRRDLPWRAAEIAAGACADYRQRGGTRETILPDFLIGAHAEVEGLTLLTRDPRRIRAAFPGVEVITPGAA